MNVVQIVSAQADEPEVRDLLEESYALMASLFPTKLQRQFPITPLNKPNARVFAARLEDVTVGCCAIILHDCFGELRNLYVSPSARGKGIGTLLLTRTEREAIGELKAVVRLETGILLKEAHRLYERTGYVRRKAFGRHIESAASLFMEKQVIL